MDRIMNSFLGGCGALLVAATVSLSPAAVITLVTVDGPDAGTNVDPATVNTIPDGGDLKLGTDGYVFFAAMPEATATQGYKNFNVQSLPSYATVTATNLGDRYLHLGNSDITIGSTLYTTGVILKATTATITLTGTVPSHFRVGILVGNNSEDDAAAAIAVSSPTGSFTTATFANYDDPHPTEANHFLVFDVQNAVAGNQIAFPVPRLGGIVFSTVPEPASLSLLGLGALGLLRRRR